MKVYLGADHRGFKLKNAIKSYLAERNISLTDVGAYKFDPGDDYPIFSEKVARQVADDFAKGSKDTRGVVICGSGVGVDIVANKFKSIRSGLAVSTEQVKQARLDDDINVLAIPADYANEDQAKEMVKAFLQTQFEPSEKHKRRLKEIEEIKNL